MVSVTKWWDNGEPRSGESAGPLQYWGRPEGSTREHDAMHHVARGKTPQEAQTRRTRLVTSRL